MTPLYRKAIQSIESSGGNYSLLGPVTKNGDRAYGAYQVMGNNIPEWTERHLGQRMTPDQFLADRDAQDKVFDAQFGSYVDKYGNPQDAASAWFTGGPRSTGANKRDVLGTSGSSYVDKFNKYINGGASEDDPTRALSYAPTERKSMPALSADSVMGPGILNMGAGAEGGADVIGRGLTGMGAALAGISSPEQGKALTALQASMMKAPGNKWSVAHVDPKTGQALLTNGQSFVPWKAFTPKPDEEKVDPSILKDLNGDWAEKYGGLHYAAGRAKEFKDLIDSGQLDLGIAAQGKAAWDSLWGKASPQSKLYNDFQSWRTQLANDSLRLNAGVQTEGDARRAKEELATAFGQYDAGTISKALHNFIDRTGRVMQDGARSQLDSYASNYNNKDPFKVYYKKLEEQQKFYDDYAKAAAAAPVAPTPKRDRPPLNSIFK